MEDTPSDVWVCGRVVIFFFCLDLLQRSLGFCKKEMLQIKILPTRD